MTRFCETCGKPLTGTGQFCEECGAPVGRHAAPVPPPPEPAAQAPVFTAPPPPGAASLLDRRIGPLPLPNLLGWVGVVLIIFSFLVPYTYSEYIPGFVAVYSLVDFLLEILPYQAVFLQGLLLVTPLLIGIVGGAIALALGRGTLVLVFGVIPFLTPVVMLAWLLQGPAEPVWLLCSIVGPALLIVAGFFMRKAALSGLRS